MKVADYFKCYHYIDSNVQESIMILAQVEPFRVCLIDLNTGNRYNDPVSVENVNDISLKEENRIFYSTGEITTHFIPLGKSKVFENVSFPF